MCPILSYQNIATLTPVYPEVYIFTLNLEMGAPQPYILTLNLKNGAPELYTFTLNLDTGATEIYIEL